MKKITKTITAILLVGCGGTAFGVEVTLKQAGDTPVLEEMLVTGGKENIQTLSGSAHLLDEDTLEQFDFSDLNRVLSLLPGVYIRSEDGFGLRPNIGVRGVTSERSQKITLMEDGVLIKPAPYSAPAAYYIPNVSRMSAVEVIKGPAAIKQGPNNVGGAVNLVTPSIPTKQSGFIDASVGTDGYGSYELFFGDSINEWGYWIDVLHYRSDGFKSLDSGGDTGFERSDINGKLQWSPDKLFGYEQRFIAKIGYAKEASDETYLGLTGSDFNNDPYRRYAASQLDVFDSEHSQIHIDHLLTASDALKWNTKVYWNRFDRAWNKLDGFFTDSLFVDPADAGTPIRSILNREDNNAFPRLLGILRGEIDSSPVPAQTLDVTNNDRKYGSTGIQFKADYTVDSRDWEHHLEASIRYHHDYIERNHSTRGYLMVNGIMVNDGLIWGNKVLNEAETDALAVFVHDTVTWQNWTFNAGVRYEDIDSEAEDFLTAINSTKSQSILVPGAGVYWQYTDSLGILFGVNKGFSPAGATAGDDADPEESVNYEYGLRYQNDGNRAELIGFFSDYKNLLGRCRASDSGCSGQEFNGGRVEVAGVEVFGEFILPVDVGNVQFPISVNYTYTESAFQSSFVSNFSQWGNVLKGDRLPYLPEHIGRLQLGARSTDWEAFVAIRYQSEMRDGAGREDIDSVLHTDAFTTVDLSIVWQGHSQWLVQVLVDNVFDEGAIVSWRPFGARPNKPRSARMRLKYSF